MALLHEPLPEACDKERQRLPQVARVAQLLGQEAVRPQPVAELAPLPETSLLLVAAEAQLQHAEEHVQPAQLQRLLRRELQQLKHAEVAEHLVLARLQPRRLGL